MGRDSLRAPNAQGQQACVGSGRYSGCRCPRWGHGCCRRLCRCRRRPWRWSRRRSAHPPGGERLGVGSRSRSRRRHRRTPGLPPLTGGWLERPRYGASYLVLAAVHLMHADDVFPGGGAPSRPPAGGGGCQPATRATVCRVEASVSVPTKVGDRRGRLRVHPVAPCFPCASVRSCRGDGAADGTPVDKGGRQPDDRNRQPAALPRG